MNWFIAGLLWGALIVTGVVLSQFLPWDSLSESDQWLRSAYNLCAGMVIYCIAYGYKKFLDYTEGRQKER